MASKSKKIEYRVNVTEFAASYVDNRESHVVVKATSARAAADAHIKAMRASGVITDDIRPAGGFSRTWTDINGDGCDDCIGRSADASGLTHRIYVRPESMY
jgi:hypothetical protein